jgi:hypothetical protein
MNTITIKKLEKLGVEKVSKFAGAINVNYLIYMNSGANGYNFKKLESMKAKYSEYVRNNFNEYIKGVIETMNVKLPTETQKYLQDAYKKWFQ